VVGWQEIVATNSASINVVEKITKSADAGKDGEFSPKNVGIAVFSGTGNTAYVTEVLAKELRDLGASVDIQRINSPGTRLDGNDTVLPNFDPARFDLVGIGHPILGFGVAPIVLRFAAALPPGRGQVFIFKSAADNHRVNNAASEKLIRLLEDKGYEVVHDFLYVMPCNWVIGYQRRFNLQIIDKVKEKAVRHAQELMAGTRSRLPIYRGWRLLARFFHYLETNYGRKQFGKALRATKVCTLCGHCISNCPVGNIREENKQIHFGKNCLWCMRCVYNCPAKAIDAQWMNWCILEEGYQLKDFLGASDAERTFITGRSRGYWKHFLEYFE
jgi:ferredoxin